MNQLKFLYHIILEKNLFYPINEEAQHLTWIRTFWLECMDCFLCPWEKSPLASLTLIWGNVLSSNNITWYNYPFFFFRIRYNYPYERTRLSNRQITYSETAYPIPKSKFSLSHERSLFHININNRIAHPIYVSSSRIKTTAHLTIFQSIRHRIPQRSSFFLANYLASNLKPKWTAPPPRNQTLLITKHH